MHKRVVKYLIVSALLILLLLIRFFEKRFFNDSLIDFFKYDYLTNPLPDTIQTGYVLLIDVLRYIANAVISITILYLLFPQKALIRFLSTIYAGFLIVDLLLFYYFLIHYQAGNYLALFYTRRFLIQPLLLFILLPALYYQSNNKKTDL